VFPYLQTLSNVIMSTSTLSAPSIDSGGFGPVGADCYAIGYGITNEACRFGVCTFPGRDGASFVSALEETVLEVQTLLEQK
jgi:hypothetical protein